MNYLAGIDMRALERGHARLERHQRGGYRNALFNSIKDRALDGQAIKFNAPFPYKDGVVMFEPDAFGDLDQHPTAFCIDHDLSTEVASTENGLELIVDDDSLQFRLDLEKAARGYVIAHLCETGNRAATSVQCDILEERTKVIAGHDVRVVSRARLREISLCAAGAAGDDAFASLVDTTITPKPVAGSRSASFQANHALHKICRKIRTLKASIAGMKAVIYDDPKPIKWSMSLAQSNALQTGRYDELAANARQQLLFR